MAQTRLSDCKASERGATVSRRGPVTYDCCIPKEEIDALFAAEDKYLPEIIAVPRRLALDKKVNPAVRRAAAQDYLDRRIGKVAEKREHSGGVRIEVICDGE